MMEEEISDEDMEVRMRRNLFDGGRTVTVETRRPPSKIASNKPKAPTRIEVQPEYDEFWGMFRYDFYSLSRLGRSKLSSVDGNEEARALVAEYRSEGAQVTILPVRKEKIDR